MTRNACKYGALTFTHRYFLLTPNIIMYSILAQEDVINEAFDVNQLYR